MNAPILSRRSFGKGLSGIVLAFALDPSELLAQGVQPVRLPGSLNNNRMLDAWIRIAPNGIATVFTGKVELGQGILTALSQIAAEELDLPLARVKMISGDNGQPDNSGGLPPQVWNVNPTGRPATYGSQAGGMNAQDKFWVVSPTGNPNPSINNNDNRDRAFGHNLRNLFQPPAPKPPTSAPVSMGSSPAVKVVRSTCS